MSAASLAGSARTSRRSARRPATASCACSAAPSCARASATASAASSHSPASARSWACAIARSTAPSAARAFFSASARSSEHGSENSRRSAESAGGIRSALVAARRAPGGDAAERRTDARRGPGRLGGERGRRQREFEGAGSRRPPVADAARGFDPGRGLFGLGEPLGRAPRAGAGGVGRLHGRARGDQGAARLLHRHRQRAQQVRGLVERARVGRTEAADRLPGRLDLPQGALVGLLGARDGAGAVERELRGGGEVGLRRAVARAARPAPIPPQRTAAAELVRRAHGVGGRALLVVEGEEGLAGGGASGAGGFVGGVITPLGPPEHPASVRRACYPEPYRAWARRRSDQESVGGFSPTSANQAPSTRSDGVHGEPEPRGRSRRRPSRGRSGTSARGTPPWSRRPGPRRAGRRCAGTRRRSRGSRRLPRRGAGRRRSGARRRP